jgi:arylsulfatase A
MNRPNVIIMLMDNLGHGDLGCTGSTHHRTPHIDQLAREGMRFTSYYSTSGVCTPSRASLMTGCYPRRVNLHVSGKGRPVLFPADSKGLHPDEVTIARMLKSRDYATCCVGKWHLGDQPPFLPTRHGFDQFFGCPYSEDMVPTASNPDWPPLPLMRNETVVESPLDREFLTQRYTAEAIRFITENKDRPFFLYLPHAMPGSTNRPFASPAFQGRSANGPYGDAIEELDWSCGEIMRTLKELALDDRTLVVWTSDNGAVGWNPPQGSNAPFTGWGYDTSEGGQRMPCIMRWPGTIPAGVVNDEIVTMMDVLPTVAAFSGAEPPRDRIIDGHDIRPILSGDPGARSAYDETGFFYYHMQQLQAVRSGPWKLYLPLQSKIPGLNVQGLSKGRAQSPAALFDVRHDLAETKNVTADHPAIVERLLAMAEKAREDLGDEGREGMNQRPAGWAENPTPRLLAVPLTQAQESLL